METWAHRQELETVDLVEGLCLELERMSASLYFANKGTSPWTTHLEGGSLPTFQEPAFLKEPGPETSPQMQTFKAKPMRFHWRFKAQAPLHSHPKQ